MSHINIQRSRIPILINQLGYAGLIPFVTLALALWMLPSNYFDQLHQALLSYAAIILSFMGAIHWGLAMAEFNTVNRFQLGISVVPALAAWFASLLTPMWNYSILIVAFVSLCLLDSYMVKNHNAPEWYPLLRIPLTVVVIISLIVAEISLL